MSELLELDAALELLAGVVTPVTESEPCALAEALHRVSARPVIAPYALPPFTSTAVDGYAFHHADYTGQPLTVSGESFAGQPYAGPPLTPGQAVRIATGAVLPEGADTVAMQEICTREGDALRFQEIPAPGANIRPQGADITPGAIAIPGNHRLRVQDIALLGALGFTHIPVRRRLRIAIASTGQELRRHGDALQAGQIIDTNGLMLKQLASNPSTEITALPALPDEYAATAGCLKSAASAHDLIVTTGGVSVGARDFLREVMHQEGVIHFWKLALRPGKPVMAGRIGKCLVAALPGNPVSAFVTFLLIARPLIDGLNGMTPSLAPMFPVALGEPVQKPETLRCFPRARLKQTENGLLAMPYADQSSNLFTSLIHADGLLDLPTGQAEFACGETVYFRPFSGLLGD